MSGNTISKQKKQIFALMLALVMAVSLFPGAGAKGADLSTYTAGSSLVDAGDILANPTFFSVEYWDYYDTLISSLSGAAEYDEIDGMFRYPVEAIPNEVTQWRVHQLSYSDGYIDKIVFKIPEYTVSFVNDDGTEILGAKKYWSETLAENIVTPSPSPTKAANAQYTYSFAGWSPEIENVTKDVKYVATYNKTVRKYTVTWQDEDGTELEKDTDVPYGEDPSYDGTKPAKAGNAQYTYTFDKWSPQVSKVTGDVTYTATYESSLNPYTITWKNEDGTVLEEDTGVLYGTTPSYDGAVPVKVADKEYTYTFDKWAPEVTAVTGAATYIATYKSSKNTYNITWKNEDGSVLEEDTGVPYGTTPSYDGAVPVKAADAENTYTFDKWAPEVKDVTGDATYTATFTRNPVKKESGGEDDKDKTYTVIWKNEDDKVLETDNDVPYGQMPEYNGDKPSKMSTRKVTYTFIGWSPNIVRVTEDTEYTAMFSEREKRRDSLRVTSGDSGDSDPPVYSITYVLDGGTNGSNPRQYTYGTGVGSFAPAEKKDCNFDGWFDAPEAGNRITSISSTSTGNITLFARFVPIPSLDGAIIKLKNLNNLTYNGKNQTVSVASVKLADNTTIEDFSGIKIKGNSKKNAGTYTLTLEGDGKKYVGTASVKWTIKKFDLKNATIVVSDKSYTYDGKSHKPTVKIYFDKNKKAVVSAEDYKCTFPKDTKNTGTKSITITAKNTNFTGKASVNYTIKKGKTSFSIKAEKTKFEVNDSKSQSTTIKISNLTAGSSKCTFSIHKVTNKQKGKVSVNKNTGRVTIKKGCKACKIEIKVVSNANTNRIQAEKSVTIIVK